jgi:5-formyltetrahydrofolate cyclo-ligase
MATPKLEKGYLILNDEAKNHPEKAATKEGAFLYGENITDLKTVDLVVEGSVAVDIVGNRLGKGGGYGDREISDLYNRKVINVNTPIATTIHPLQVKNSVPVLEHDFKINMIVTSKSKIYTKNFNF